MGQERFEWADLRGALPYRVGGVVVGCAAPGVTTPWKEAQPPQVRWRAGLPGSRHRKLPKSTTALGPPDQSTTAAPERSPGILAFT